MGYKVMCCPKNGVPGLLARGRLADNHLSGTYYSSPSAAKKAAESWLARNPGANADVLTWRDGALVETLYGPTL